MEKDNEKKSSGKIALIVAVVLVLIALLAFGLYKNQNAKLNNVILRSDVTAALGDTVLPWEGEDTEEVTQLQAAAALLSYAGMTEEQLPSFPEDYAAMADSIGLTYDADQPCTLRDWKEMKGSDAISALKDALSAEKKAPLFLNGMAQPIFPFTPGNVPADEYSNETSDTIRYSVYVETNHDTDGDGKLDLVKAFIQLPRAAAEGDYQAGVIYEARPYITGCTDNGMEYIDEPLGFDMYASPDPRVSNGTATTMDVAAEATSDEWYYWNPYEDFDGFMDYEDLTWYDYFLARGYAVVECGGLGTRGSEGFETCGSDLEIDAFKCVIEWLTGDRKAFTDKEGNIEIAADWSNGNVGMTGRSYAGTTQFGLAATGVDGLKTIVPVAGIASWYDYTNAQGIATQDTPAYTDTLAAFCAGRYLDSNAAAEAAMEAGHDDYVSNGEYENIADAYGRYLNQMESEQIALNGDYGEHWAKRDYTTGAENINCSALIVHGLNDFNVRTKHFDLMHQAFTAAGQDVKLLLHQDGHLTPDYDSHGDSFLVNGQLYNDILNQWFSHYLYNVDNGAENMPAVLAEDAHTNTWHTYDSWESAVDLSLTASAEQETTVLSSNYTDVYDAEEEDWNDVFTSNSTTGSAFYVGELDTDTVIKGATEIHFSASVNNEKALADGQDLNRDALMVSAMLVDIAPEGETFPVFDLRGHSYLPTNTVEKGGAWMGCGLDRFNLLQHVNTEVESHVVARGWMDLCNPNAGYASASSTADNKVNLKAGEYHDYTLYLQPTIYQVEAGHKLALVIFAQDPDMVEYDENYTITVNNASVSAAIPVDGAEAPAAITVEYQPVVLEDASAEDAA